MDKKDKNYIPPGTYNSRSSYGRKVVPRVEYDIDRAHDELREKRAAQRRKQAGEKIRKRRRMRALRMRALCATVVTVIIVVILLFFTPLLNIRNFNIMGNSIVSSEDILARLEPLKDTNLIWLSGSDVANQLSDISYIEEISVSKHLIPPSASVMVKECMPAAKVEMDGYNIVIDPQLKVLSDGEDFDVDEMAHIDGLEVTGYAIGKTLQTDAEKAEILGICLETMNSLGMLPKLDYIDLTDITNIRFGYDDRIDALCGTRLEIERKIRMFNVAVTGNNIADNAHGIIDLSVSGKAVYTP